MMRRERDAIYHQVMDRGWSPTRQAFVQHYDTDVLDASLLYMPLVGFVAPNDPVHATKLVPTLKAGTSALRLSPQGKRASPPLR